MDTHNPYPQQSKWYLHESELHVKLFLKVCLLKNAEKPFKAVKAPSSDVLKAQDNELLAKMVTCPICVLQHSHSICSVSVSYEQQQPQRSIPLRIGKLFTTQSSFVHFIAPVAVEVWGNR